MFSRVETLSRTVGSAKKNLPVCCIRQVQICLQRYRSLLPVQNLCDTPLVMKSWSNLDHHPVRTATTTLASSELVSCHTTRRSSRWRNKYSQGRNQSALMLLPNAFKEEVVLLWQCDIYQLFFVIYPLNEAATFLRIKTKIVYIHTTLGNAITLSASRVTSNNVLLYNCVWRAWGTVQPFEAFCSFAMRRC